MLRVDSRAQCVFFWEEFWRFLSSAIKHKIKRTSEQQLTALLLLLCCCVLCNRCRSLVDDIDSRSNGFWRSFEMKTEKKVVSASERRSEREKRHSAPTPTRLFFFFAFKKLHFLLRVHVRRLSNSSNFKWHSTRSLAFLDSLLFQCLAIAKHYNILFGFELGIFTLNLSLNSQRPVPASFDRISTVLGLET